MTESTSEEPTVFVSDGTSVGTHSRTSSLDRSDGELQVFATDGGRYYALQDAGSDRARIWFQADHGEPQLVGSGRIDPGVVFHNDRIYALARKGGQTELFVAFKSSVSQLELNFSNVTKLIATTEDLFIQADGFVDGILRTQAIWRATSDFQAFEFVVGTENATTITAAGNQLFFIRDEVVRVVRNNRVTDLFDVGSRVRPTAQILMTPSQYGVYLTLQDARELWFLDGALAGSKLVFADTAAVNDPLSRVFTLNEVSYFLLRNETNDVNLWSYHPDQGHAVVQRIPGGSVGSLRSLAGRLHFTGEASQYWTSDGTPQGTRQFDVRWTSSEIVQLNESTVVFPGSRDIENVEPWRSDGTVEGTQQILELNPDFGDAEFTASGDFVNVPADRFRQIERAVVFRREVSDLQIILFFGDTGTRS